MSKLAALLRRASRSEPAPMGFALTAGRAKSPGLLITAELQSLDLDQARAAAKAGADTVLLGTGDLEADAAAIRAITKAIEAPCGLRLAGSASNPITAGTAAQALGLDYLQIDGDDTPAAALLEDEPGFVLTVAKDAPDTMLRLLESMPFDALFADTLQKPLTIRQQLELRRISGLARKPLFLHIPDSLSSEDLECLRDAGVGMAVISGGSDLDQQIGGLRQTITAMRPRRKRRERTDSIAVLPSIHHADEGEGEGEEEESGRTGACSRIRRETLRDIDTGA